MGGWRYCSAHCWPRHWMEVSCQLRDRAALPPARDPTVSLGWQDRWDQEPVWTRWRGGGFLIYAGIETPVVAIPAGKEATECHGIGCVTGIGIYLRVFIVP